MHHAQAVSGKARLGRHVAICARSVSLQQHTRKHQRRVQHLCPHPCLPDSQLPRPRQKCPHGHQQGHRQLRQNLGLIRYWLSQYGALRVQAEPKKVGRWRNRTAKKAAVSLYWYACAPQSISTVWSQSTHLDLMAQIRSGLLGIAGSRLGGHCGRV